LWKNRLQHQARRSAQRVLKNRAYDHLRAALLGNPASNMPLVTLVSLPSALFFQSTSLSPDRPLRRDCPSRACFHLLAPNTPTGTGAMRICTCRVHMH
jgi:hypothetical protein